MTINFEIKDNYALKYEGRHIDLHNNFNLVEYNYKIANRQLDIIWTKSSGDWVNEGEFSKLILVHFNVFFVNIEYDNRKYSYPEDDKCLGDISFFLSSERQINDELTPQSKPNEGDDIIYIFESGHFIRIGCEEIKLIVEKY